jgi:iron complex outermembrane receptor protein
MPRRGPAEIFKIVRKNKRKRQDREGEKMTQYKVRLRSRDVALGAIVCALLAGPGWAQSSDSQAPAPAANDTPEIVVTAQFRSQRLQDTPIAITAVTAATLEARGQTSVVDIGAYSPNVNLSQATAINNNAVSAFIRGVGQDNSGFAFEPGVGIYIDDVYYGTTFGANLDLTDLDRVEVLRGPQGTLSGKNSVGGAIKLFSKKPDGDEGGFLEGTYGRFNRIDIRGSADFKLGDGWFVRVSGVAKKVGGYFTELDFGCANPGQGLPAQPNSKNCVIGHEGGTDQKALRLALRYAPAGSRLTVDLVGDINDDTSQPVADKLVYADNPAIRSYVASDATAGVPFDSRFITGAHSYTSYATFNSGGNYTALGFLPTQVVPGSFNPGRVNTARNYGGSAVVNYELADNFSLTSITAWRRASGETSIDVDGSPLAIIVEDLKLRHEQFTEEVRATGKVGTLIDYTVGGFYYDAHDRQYEHIQIPTVLFDFLTNDPVSNKSESAFAHVEFHPVEGLNVIGGVRYTHDEKTYTFSRRNIDGTLPSGIPLTTNFIIAGLDGLSGTYKGNHVDYRIGVNYRWNTSLMTYAQVATGFKGGGVNPTPYVADQIVPFGPEKLTSYEVGFKSDLFDRALRIDGDVFYNIYRNLQEQLYYCPQSTSTTCALETNGGNAHVKGAELEVTVRPVRALTINGSLGYLDFNYTNVNALTGITKDMKAPFTNKWQASGGVEYAIDLGGKGSLTPRFDVAYQSSFYYNSVNNPYNLVAGRAVSNGRITYESPNKSWMLAASVTNLFNKFYATGINENIVNYGVVTQSIGRPREWSVTIRRRF